MPLAIAILGFLAPLIPPLAKWLAGRASGYNAWKSQITYWTARPRSIFPQFFGREAELKAVSHAFKRGDSVVLSGGPGTGKSQLAAEFVQKSKRNGFWTPGGETPAQTLTALAPHLGIDPEGLSGDVLLHQTRRRLQAVPAKTLWVIDNLSNLDQLNTLLNETGKILLLVTTQDGRESVVPHSVEFQPVGVLHSEPAVYLLCRSRRHDPKEPVFLALVEEVGRLPRAVEALAVQLDSPGETPERLLQELRAALNPLELDRFRNQTGGLQIPRTESLFNALRGPVEALPEGAREALAHLGYIADLPIPMPLAEALTGLADGAMINFLEECSSKSVLSADEDRITLHSLTAAAISATNEKGIPVTTLFRVHERLSSINQAEPRALRLEIAHHQNILEQAKKILGPEAADVLSFGNNLAIGYGTLGRYEEAVRLHEETLSIMERVLGPEHANTLSSRGNLANGYRYLGRYEEAVRLDEETLSIMGRVVVPGHPDTLGIRSNLAGGYHALGRYEEGVRLHEETLSIRERVLGPEHPDALGSRSNLAIGYRALGRYEEAVRLEDQTLRISERVLGPEHPDTIQSRNNLAGGYGALGRREEAVRLDEGTLSSRERVLGPEHPDSLTSRNNLANGHRALGRYKEAVRLDEDTLRIRARVLGPEHPDTIQSRNNLAVGYGALGAPRGSSPA